MLDLWGKEGGLRVDGAFVGGGPGGEGAGSDIVAKKLFVNNIDDCGDEGLDVFPSLL